MLLFQRDPPAVLQTAAAGDELRTGSALLCLVKRLKEELWGWGERGKWLWGKEIVMDRACPLVLWIHSEAPTPTKEIWGVWRVWELETSLSQLS